MKPQNCCCVQKERYGFMLNTDVQKRIFKEF